MRGTHPLLQLSCSNLYGKQETDADVDEKYRVTHCEKALSVFVYQTNEHIYGLIKKQHRLYLFIRLTSIYIDSLRKNTACICLPD